MKSLLCLCAILILSNPLYAKTQLTYAVNPSSVAQQEIYHLLARRFEQVNPEVEIKVVSRLLEEHKLRIKRFSEDGIPFADVIMGYAGAQLALLANSNRLMNIDTLWQQQGLDLQFSANSKNVVSVNQHIVAIPLNYYQWGIYYRKQLLQDAGLSPPTTWQELLNVVNRLRKRNITPFSLSGGSNWSLAAWFDYIDLRVNGLKFHQMLLRGDISYMDPRLAKVFDYWKQLIDSKAFETNHLPLTWQQSLPFLYRDLTAMTLMGNFFVAHIPQEQKDKFGFTAFPNMVEGMPRYEDVPYDVAFIDKNTTQPELAVRFLLFLADAETQTLFSNYVGKISPNLAARTSDKYFIAEGKKHIETAAGLAQYFDRDSNNDFTQAAQKLFYEFVESPDKQKDIIRQLETLRVRYLIHP